MDILKDINDNVSSLVGSSFDEFISMKVTEEIEKGKDKFLNDLNMCEEEYPVYDENKHQKFTACKIVNDDSLPYQIGFLRKSVDTSEEFILRNIDLSGIKIDIPDMLNFGHIKPIYSITNKGNIYVSDFYPAICGQVLFQSKILEFIKFSNCRGSTLQRGGGVDGRGIKGVVDREHAMNKFLNKHNGGSSLTANQLRNISPERVADASQETDDFMKSVNGINCKYSKDNHIVPNGRWANHIVDQRTFTCYSERNHDLFHYEDHVGWREDCIERFMTNNICKGCRSGEVIPEKLDSDINIEILMNPPIFNNEYIDLLELMTKNKLTIPIYQIQTIYAKYHPRANENHVIEEKIKKLSKLEETVNERVSEEKDILENKSNKLNNAWKIYSEKINKINEERKINSGERQNNIDDKNTIKEMIKLTKGKCNKKESECDREIEQRQRDFNERLDIQGAELQKQKEEHLKEKEEYRQKLYELIVITNDINEINENQEDESCKSDELFEIIKKFKALAK